MNATRTATTEAVSPPSAALNGGETRTATPTAAASPRNMASHKRISAKRSLAGSAAFVAAALTIYSGYRWWDTSRAWVTTDNAYVRAQVHSISARVAGTVQAVLVDENQEVEAGTILARLDARDFEVRRAQAEAQLAQSRAQMEQTRAKISQARAQLARERARAEKASNDLVRAKALFEGKTGTISGQDFDQAQSEAAAARAAVEEAQAAIEAAQSGAAAAKALEQVAAANLQEADLQISYTVITAPVSGQVGRKELEIGNRVQPGQPLLALVQPSVWITANFKETQLAKMEPGQKVRVRVDAFPGRFLTGRVESLSPASGAQFALLPPDNATGNFTRIVQRVPVKIVLDREEIESAGLRIVPGMSARVEVRVRNEQPG